MKKLFTILLTFAILTIYHYEVRVFGSPNIIARSSYLVRTKINESLVSRRNHGIFLYKGEKERKEGWNWYIFIPYSQIVNIEKRAE